MQGKSEEKNQIVKAKSETTPLLFFHYILRWLLIGSYWLICATFCYHFSELSLMLTRSILALVVQADEFRC